MVNFKNSALTALLLLWVTVAYAGGGWTPKAGTNYLKVGQYSILARHYYTPAGDRVPITTTGVHITSVYWEHGFTDRLGLVAYVPIFSRSTLNRVVWPDGSLKEEGDQLTGIGDPEVRLKYSLYQKGPWALSVAVGVGIPLGNPGGGQTELLQTGDGEFNQKLLLEGSRSFAGGRGYASALVGVNNRTKNFSEELHYGAELGYRFGPVWLIGRLMGLESFKNGDDALVVTNGVFSNNLEYLSLSPEVVWEANERWGLTAGMATALRGERILADPAYTAGVYVKW